MPAGCQGAAASSERCVGWVLDRVLITTAFSPYDDAGIATYVAMVGRRLVQASGDRRAWTFRVLDSTEVQAFAGLSTTVYVNRGALALLRSEAELAAVLGHEIGHVLGGHLRENFDELGKDLGRSPLAESHATRYARDDEIQADEVAVLLLVRAGYDPRAVERMLRAYAATSPTDGNDAGDHHPRWTERVARVQALAAVHPGGELGEPRFRARIANLIVGDDPRTAAIVGRAAVFAHAGVAVDLPAALQTIVDARTIALMVDARVVVDLRMIDPAIARTFRAPPAHDTAFELVPAGRRVLAISVKGPDAAALAHRMRRSVRPPRPDELAQLRPQRIDLDAPRVLWLP
jgi:predicted Zn-dependent protease